MADQSIVCRTEAAKINGWNVHPATWLPVFEYYISPPTRPLRIINHSSFICWCHWTSFLSGNPPGPYLFCITYASTVASLSSSQSRNKRGLQLEHYKRFQPFSYIKGTAPCEIVPFCKLFANYCYS